MEGGEPPTPASTNYDQDDRALPSPPSFASGNMAAMMLANFAMRMEGDEDVGYDNQDNDDGYTKVFEDDSEFLFARGDDGIVDEVEDLTQDKSVAPRIPSDILSPGNDDFWKPIVQGAIMSVAKNGPFPEIPSPPETMAIPERTSSAVASSKNSPHRILRTAKSDAMESQDTFRKRRDEVATSTDSDATSLHLSFISNAPASGKLNGPPSPEAVKRLMRLNYERNTNTGSAGKVFPAKMSNLAANSPSQNASDSVSSSPLDGLTIHAPEAITQSSQIPIPPPRNETLHLHAVSSHKIGASNLTTPKMVTGAVVIPSRNTSHIYNAEENTKAEQFTSDSNAEDDSAASDFTKRRVFNGGVSQYDGGNGLSSSNEPLLGLKSEELTSAMGPLGEPRDSGENKALATSAEFQKKVVVGGPEMQRLASKYDSSGDEAPIRSGSDTPDSPDPPQENIAVSYLSSRKQGPVILYDSSTQELPINEKKSSNDMITSLFAFFANSSTAKSSISSSPNSASPFATLPDSVKMKDLPPTPSEARKLIKGKQRAPPPANIIIVPRPHKDPRDSFIPKPAPVVRPNFYPSTSPPSAEVFIDHRGASKSAGSLRGDGVLNPNIESKDRATGRLRSGSDVRDVRDFRERELGGATERAYGTVSRDRDTRDRPSQQQRQQIPRGEIPTSERNRIRRSNSNPELAKAFAQQYRDHKAPPVPVIPPRRSGAGGSSGATLTRSKTGFPSLMVRGDNDSSLDSSFVRRGLGDTKKSLDSDRNPDVIRSTLGRSDGGPPQSKRNLPDSEYVGQAKGSLGRSELEPRALPSTGGGASKSGQSSLRSALKPPRAATEEEILAADRAEREIQLQHHQLSLQRSVTLGRSTSSRGRDPNSITVKGIIDRDHIINLMVRRSTPFEVIRSKILDKITAIDLPESEGGRKKPILDVIRRKDEDGNMITVVDDEDWEVCIEECDGRITILLEVTF